MREQQLRKRPSVSTSGYSELRVRRMRTLRPLREDRASHELHEQSSRDCALAGARNATVNRARALCTSSALSHERSPSADATPQQHRLRHSPTFSDLRAQIIDRHSSEPVTVPNSTAPLVVVRPLDVEKQQEQFTISELQLLVRKKQELCEAANEHLHRFGMLLVQSLITGKLPDRTQVLANATDDMLVALREAETEGARAEEPQTPPPGASEEQKVVLVRTSAPPPPLFRKPKGPVGVVEWHARVFGESRV